MPRLLEFLLAAMALVALAPIWVLVAFGIAVSSPGPVFFRQARSGRGGTEFRIWKFRTMHARPTPGGSITTLHDPRVFSFGRLLRATKLDETPQLLNILAGEMAIVGPRPEIPEIVDRAYTPAFLRTLDVPPGLTSLGSVFYYTHGDLLLDGVDSDEAYEASALPVKIALDTVGMRRRSLSRDLVVVGRTARALLFQILNRRSDVPGEWGEAEALVRRWIERGDFEGRFDTAPLRRLLERIRASETGSRTSVSSGRR